MTYKGMLLSALLVPVAVTSYGQESIDPRTQQLKEARFQKELELSGLGAKIDEKHKLLGEMYADACTFFAKLVNESKLTGKALDEFKQALQDSIKKFEKLLKDVIKTKKDIKSFFLEELFNEKPYSEDFEALKFWSLRVDNERDLLESLVERYGECFQEIVELDRELDALQKEDL